MTRDDIQKLLGGYATGTLTPEEQQALFAAALEDQELFDALAKEQALRDLLRDPAARAQVLAAIDEHPEPWWQRASRWMLGPAAVVVMAVCLAAIGGYAVWHARQTKPPILVADNIREQAAPALSTPVPEPARSELQQPTKRAVPRAIRKPAGLPSASEPVPAPAPPPAQAAAPIPAPQGPVQQRVIPSQQQTVTVTAAAGPVVKAPVLPTPARAPLTAMSFRESNAFALDGAISLVKWSTLRREPDGDLSPVPPDEIHAGDAIVLRLEPFADGQLSVIEPVPGSATPRVVVAPIHVERAKPLETEPLTMDHPGLLELLVQFTPQAGIGGGGGARAAKEPVASPSPGQPIVLRYR